MELKDVVNELRADIAQFTEEQVMPLKERLLSLEERDTAPQDEKVQDVEKRLDEIGLQVGEKCEALEEQVRLMQAGNGIVVGEAKADEPFRGAFIKDVEGARRQFAEQRTIDSALFSSDAGKLSTETADSFIDFFVNEQTSLSRVDVRRMSGPRATIDRLNFATEKIRLATESGTQAVSDSVTVSRRNLTTSEIIWTEDISQTFLEDNIQRGNVESLIAGKLGQAFGTDMNSLAWRGDTAEANTTFLGVDDGWNHLMEAEGTVIDVDLSGNTTGSVCKDNLNAVLKAMPSKYRTINDLAFFCAPGFAQSYADELADRVSVMGDGALVNGFPSLRYFGIPIVPESAFITKSGDTGAAALGAKLCLTPQSNLVFGIQRDITVDAEWVPRKRIVEYTMSARVDFEFAFGGVIVLGNQIDSSVL